MEWMERLKSVARKTVDAFRELLHLDETKIAIEDAAVIIMHHPSTTKQSKTFLDLTYNTYKLAIGTYHYYVMTKGKEHEQLLELKIDDAGDDLVSYYSYKKDLLPADRVELPKNAVVRLAE